MAQTEVHRVPNSIYNDSVPDSRLALLVRRVRYGPGPPAQWLSGLARIDVAQLTRGEVTKSGIDAATGFG